MKSSATSESRSESESSFDSDFDSCSGFYWDSDSDREESYVTVSIKSKKEPGPKVSWDGVKDEYEDFMEDMEDWMTYSGYHLHFV